jgi:hypothetical protein
MLHPMRHSTSLVTLIERAEAETPTCACGGAMLPVERDGALWLECAELSATDRGLAARLRAAFGHDRVLLLDAEELAA